jgi:hypothetical protein
MVKNSIFSILLEPNLKKAIARSILFQNEPLIVHFEDTEYEIFNMSLEELSEANLSFHGSKKFTFAHMEYLKNFFIF